MPVQSIVIEKAIKGYLRCGDLFNKQEHFETLKENRFRVSDQQWETLYINSDNNEHKLFALLNQKTNFSDSKQTYLLSVVSGSSNITMRISALKCLLKYENPNVLNKMKLLFDFEVQEPILLEVFSYLKAYYGPEFDTFMLTSIENTTEIEKRGFLISLLKSVKTKKIKNFLVNILVNHADFSTNLVNESIYVLSFFHGDDVTNILYNFYFETNSSIEKLLILNAMIQRNDVLLTNLCFDAIEINNTYLIEFSIKHLIKIGTREVTTYFIKNLSNFDYFPHFKMIIEYLLNQGEESHLKSLKQIWINNNKKEYRVFIENILLKYNTMLSKQLLIEIDENYFSPKVQMFDQSVLWKL